MNGRLQLEVMIAKEKLANMERHKINGIKVRSRMRWKDKGDWCTVEFFKVVKTKAKNAAITKLANEQNEMVTD